MTPSTTDQVAVRGGAIHSTNPIYVSTKFVVAAARATTALASALMLPNNIHELKPLDDSFNGLTSRPHERRRVNSPQAPSATHASPVAIVHLSPDASPHPEAMSAHENVTKPSNTLPLVRKQGDAPTSRPHKAPAPWSEDPEVFPAWIRERKDFQVFFPRFSDHVITDDELLQQGVPKDPSERNIVELQCIARWIMKIPSMSTFLDLNQATEIAKLAQYRSYRPHEYVFRKNDIGDACYLVLNGQVHVIVDDKKVASITKNAAFGDIALQLEKATRGADVKVGGSAAVNGGLGCEVLMVTAEDYRKTLARCQTRRRKHLMSWLHTEVTLFRDCVESKLHFFELVAIDVVLKQGEVLYVQGEPIGAFYIVRSGRVRLEVDFQYEHRHRWPSGKHSWKQQIHAVHSRVPFHTETSAGFFGFEMFVEGQQSRAYTVVADSASVELTALNRVDCLSPYFSFTPRALDRIRDKNDECRDMAQRKMQQQLRAFHRSQTTALQTATPSPVIVRHKFPQSHEPPAYQFPCLRPAKWKAANEVVSAFQEACQL